MATVRCRRDDLPVVTQHRMFVPRHPQRCGAPRRRLALRAGRRTGQRQAAARRFRRRAGPDRDSVIMRHRGDPACDDNECTLRELQREGVVQPRFELLTVLEGVKEEDSTGLHARRSGGLLGAARLCAEEADVEMRYVAAGEFACRAAWRSSVNLPIPPGCTGTQQGERLPLPTASGRTWLAPVTGPPAHRLVLPPACPPVPSHPTPLSSFRLIAPRCAADQ